MVPVARLPKVRLALPFLCLYHEVALPSDFNRRILCKKKKKTDNNKAKPILDMLYFLGKQVNVCVFLCLHIDVHKHINMSVCVCRCVSKGPVYGQQGENTRTDEKNILS